MEHLDEYVALVRDASGWFGPFLFIVLHIIRPLLFIPVILVCIIGGLIFGIIPGILYSLIGITISCLIFYFLATFMPNIASRLTWMKGKVIGDNVQMTVGQIAILRLIPFIHFHLLSFLIYESSKRFKEYLKASFATTIPIAVVYTVIGQSIINFSPVLSATMLFFIAPFFYLFRSKESTLTIREFLN